MKAGICNGSLIYKYFTENRDIIFRSTCKKKKTTTKKKKKKTKRTSSVFQKEAMNEEPVCFSRFDYDYQIVQRLVTLEKAYSE